jgi:hypothetical protein
VLSSGALPDLEWEVGGSRDEENRGRASTLSLFIPQEKVEPWKVLTQLSRLQVQCRETVDWFTGVVGPMSQTEVGRHLKLEYRCYDRWHILKSDRMWNDIIGDGMTLGEYVRYLVRGAGFHDDEIRISGAATELRLPRAKPGEQPVLRPEWGGSRGDHLTRLLDDFGYYLDMWLDGSGVFHLEPLATVNRPDVHFHRQSQSLTDRRVMINPQTEVDDSDFVNYILVLGKKVRGRELQAFWADYRSVYDPTYELFAGRWLSDQPYHNEALNTQQYVNMATAWRAYRKCRARRTIGFETYYDDTLNVGDRFRCDDQVVELLSASADDRSSDMMNLNVRVVA